MKQEKNGDCKFDWGKLKKKPFQLILILVVILILILVLLGSCDRRKVGTIYFREPFDTGDSINTWNAKDAQWQTDVDQHSGVAVLARKVYAAPYLSKTLKAEQSSTGDYVLHMTVRVDSFTDEAVTLGTLILPSEQITVIVNRDGHLGIARQLFETPLYSKSSLDRIKTKEWIDLYLQVSPETKKVVLYKGKSKVISASYQSTLSPVHEMWLGAIWLNGGGRYGAPLNISYDLVELGDSNMLPHFTFVDYSANIGKRVWNQIQNAVF